MVGKGKTVETGKGQRQCGQGHAVPTTLIPGLLLLLPVSGFVVVAVVYFSVAFILIWKNQSATVLVSQDFRNCGLHWANSLNDC